MSDTIYKKHTGTTVANHKNASHLNQEEKGKLNELTNGFEYIIEGKAGDFNGSEVTFKLKDDATSYHARPYHIPQAHI